VVGGVIEIKCQDFVARAAEARYDPVKKTLTLVGAGTISVEVEKQGNTGHPQKLSSTKVIYNLDKKTFRLEDGHEMKAK
jgi:lipopolysaccharide export system protein LptA